MNYFRLLQVYALAKTLFNQNEIPPIRKVFGNNCFRNLKLMLHWNAN